jgi:thiosulfate dehydrogenase [quinone] large subunit
MKKEYIAYLLARLPLGMSFLGHGLVRLPKLEAFSNGLVTSFSKSILPASLALPFLELLTGILLFLGLFTRFAIFLGALLMLSLIFGSSMIEQWENVFTQLFYSGYLALLFYFLPYNNISIDGARNGYSPFFAEHHS